jgi:hypothetical protein
LTIYCRPSQNLWKALRAWSVSFKCVPGQQLAEQLCNTVGNARWS